jgi:hypothetical protein
MGSIRGKLSFIGDPPRRTSIMKSNQSNRSQDPASWLSKINSRNGKDTKLFIHMDTHVTRSMKDAGAINLTPHDEG